VVYIRRLTLFSEFLNDDNDSKLTIVGGKLLYPYMHGNLPLLFDHDDTSLHSLQ